MADTKFGSNFLGEETNEPMIIGDTPIAVEQPRKRAPKYGRAEPRLDEPTLFGSDPSPYARTAESALHAGEELHTEELHVDRELNLTEAHEPIIYLPETADLSEACEPIVGAIELDTGSFAVDEEPPAITSPTDIVAMVDEACEAETQILAAGAMPPERVKFTAPLEVMVEGHGDLHRGVVLNLSSTGLACAMPLELTPGQRVWVRFKLSLAEEPLSLLCAVIWRRDADPQHVLYGLQFTSLAEDEATRIGTTVRERLDGRAADWPLPLMPSGELPRPTPRKQTSTWTSAAFGMIGGMALALALSALPHIVSAPADEGTLPAAEVAQVEPQPVSPTPVAVGAQAPEAEVEMPSPDAIAGAMQQVEHAAVANALAQTKPEIAKAGEPKKELASTATVSAPTAASTPTAKAVAEADIAKTEAELAKHPPNGGLLPRKSSSTTAQVTIVGGATQKARTFWLDNPRRYVVDVPGKHGTAKAPEDTDIINRVRTGTYDDKTRYVMEVAANVHDARVEPRGNALVVTLSK